MRACFLLPCSPSCKWVSKVYNTTIYNHRHHHQHTIIFIRYSCVYCVLYTTKTARPAFVSPLIRDNKTRWDWPNHCPESSRVHYGDFIHEMHVKTCFTPAELPRTNAIVLLCRRVAALRRVAQPHTAAQRRLLCLCS